MSTAKERSSRGDNKSIDLISSVLRTVINVVILFWPLRGFLMTNLLNKILSHKKLIIEIIWLIEKLDISMRGLNAVSNENK